MSSLLTTKLNDGRQVLAKNYKGDVCAKTFANMTQARRAAEVVRSELSDDQLVRITGYRPFYVTIEHWTERFNECCPAFRDEIAEIARRHGKTVKQVYLWWREYSAACQSGDQSAVMGEFLQWYAKKLGPKVGFVISYPSPGGTRYFTANNDDAKNGRWETRIESATHYGTHEEAQAIRDHLGGAGVVEQKGVA